MTAPTEVRAAPPAPGTATGAVVVIGGYGAVGRAVAESLARGGRPLVIAGRDGAKAAELASALGPSARGVAADAADEARIERTIAGAAAVVMCVERGNDVVARLCLENGIAYVDVSATPTVLESIQGLDAIARRHGATALVSVGLAPGVTNVLARLAHRTLSTADEIDLTLLFGLAGDNGADSRRWIMEGLTRAQVEARSKAVQVASVGRRRAHPFPFSDQYTLTHVLGVPVTTRMCFESRAVTASAFALRRLGVVRLARRLGGDGLIERAMGGVHLGSDRFVIQAEAHRGGDTAAYAVTGRGECRATGHVAAAATELVLAGKAPTGVHHLDEVVDIGFLYRLSGVLRLHARTGRGTS